ncbi:hypothetical protein F3Y22_tig00001120pilonHSYRG00402 [Hibiscus syriacus]|uniref:Cellulose synthase RING-type zinc finger domain-containing protein n=1 Tax=Hibiscus syriacus TaxID=106335 RepID=A0A6A3CVU1_HIBSY|nr:hypothetical protein F3Y22_tig00001120pilonHSYRG00402 [Hibiscus syriacus]
MQVNCGLVVGTHDSNELLVIRLHGDDSSQGTAREYLISQTCNICGDEIGLTADGELFMACDECAFPICRVCYEYERKEGNQACPRCKTRFKRLKGCPRMEGDEEEVGIDDLENELDFQGRNNEQHHLVVPYGYESVAWKDRMETWKQEKQKLQLMKSDNGSKDVFCHDFGSPFRWAKLVVYWSWIIMERLHNQCGESCEFRIARSTRNTHRNSTIRSRVFLTLSSEPPSEGCLCFMVCICHL